MLRRRAAATVAVLMCGGAITAAASAAGSSGPPPPPKATNGAKVQEVASGLMTPTSFAFGAGVVFEGDGGNSESGPPNGGVYVLKGGKATKLAPAPQFVGGLTWHGGTLYLSAGTLGASGPQWQILAWSGWNGTTFTTKRVVWTAPSKLDGLNGIAYGPDGRLYVGVDVGLTDGNDHGAPKTPYVYDILSLKPNGKGLKVYATGIRQPWQFAFTPGSRNPLVSDLGQDAGITNAPDFILRVHQGDNYGFPQCNQTVAKKCKGFAKPFEKFGPHTDIMGLAVIGKRLYMTSFQGPSAHGPGGEVFSMPLTGGKLKPVLTGFVAPTVGLGAHAGWLYVGELTGQVFRVKP